MSVKDDKPVAIILSVRLTDDTFSSSVSVPVTSPQAEKDAAVKKWLSIMQFGLSMHGDEVTIKTEIHPTDAARTTGETE